MITELKKMLFLSCLLLLSSLSVAEAALKDLTLIRDLKLLSSPDELRVVVKTGGMPVELLPLNVLNDRLLQLDIKNSYTEPAKRSYSIDDPFMEKVELYQLDDTTVRMRMYLLSSFEKGGERLWKNDGGFTIALNRNALEADFGGIKSEVKGAAPKSESIEEAFPSIFGREQEEDAAGIAGSRSGDSEGLSPVVRMISALALVLGVFLVGAYLFKKRFLGKGVLGKGDLIKVLDRSYIDVKKSVSIVDVAGEILVLGISGEGITMLTKLDNEKSLSKLKGYGEDARKASFTDSVREASKDLGEGPSESVIDRIKKLRPLN